MNTQIKTHWFVAYQYILNNSDGGIGVGSCTINTDNIIFKFQGMTNDIKTILQRDGVNVKAVVITNFIQLTDEQIKIFES